MSGAAYIGCAPLAGAPTSFDLLPLELRLKCLANCDWQTLARVSCVNRSTRGLVTYLVRTPYWRTYGEEVPAVLTTDFATDEERQAACSKWAAGMASKLCGRGKPDICFVFASASGCANLPIMLGALRASMARCTLLAGVVAPGVLGRDTEDGKVKEIDGLERVGLVVSVVHLPPGCTVDAALITHGLAADWSDPNWQPPQGSLPEGPARHPRTWLMLSDRHAHVDDVLQEISRRYPREPVCGGMGGSTDHAASSLLVGLPGRLPGQPLHAEVTSGTLLIGISGPGVEAVPMTSRGMRCISQRYMVSQVSTNVDLAPVGRVTLVQQLQNSISLATGTDALKWVPVGGSFTPTSALVASLQAQGPHVAPRAPLFFGVRSPGSSRQLDDPTRMVMLQMHDPNNLMRTSGYVSVQHAVDRGMLAAFYTPEPILSMRHLRNRLEAARPLMNQRASHRPEDFCTLHHNDDSLHRLLSAEPEPVYGCLMFPCVAKGSSYYDEPDVESKLVQVAFPNAALCGFFCNGEIGPTPADELSPTHSAGGEKRAHMMGYSTVVYMLKLTPGPPLPPEWTR